MNYSDRFGMRNVYWKKTEIDREFQASNNLQELIYNNGFSDFSAKGVSSYFTFRYPVLGLTMFEAVERVDTEWRPRFSFRNVSDNQASAEIEQLLIESITRIVQDKQVIGITLSGGLDSSLIVSLCRHLYPRRQIYTYSCGFYGDDEFEFSRQVAGLFSTKHDEMLLGKDDFVGSNSIMPSLIKHKCAPLHPNELALAHAALKAKLDQCDVVLCGEGADDIFGGYGHNLRMFMTYTGGPTGFFDYIIRNYRYFTEEERRTLLNPRYCTDVERECNVLTEFPAPLTDEDKMLYFIQRLHTRGLVERGVNALVYGGIEPGFPFIDNDLVDYVNSLPFNMKVRWKSGKAPENPTNLSFVDINEKYDISKYILKKVAEKYLPDSIVYRRKKGFPVPFDLWFNNVNTWPLDYEVFRSHDISQLNGWKKFMVINLDTFIKVFKTYKF